MNNKTKKLLEDIPQVSEEEIFEYRLADFDKSIIDLGVTLASEAAKSTNLDYKFKLVESIVQLRGALPPFYAVQSKMKTL